MARTNSTCGSGAVGLASAASGKAGSIGSGAEIGRNSVSAVGNSSPFFFSSGRQA
ncbi:hypothetical protein [Paracoccus sp. pheM1]|uniref:hypothetical protein n=1 Tax=Paracoccus sp. pheM1 TaxID=2831675 RepID=UPI001F0AB40E|nr:hypothetical protein [Paracoccus sp. pheM1]